jgi:nickel-dependent lactate racemase
MFYEWMKKFKDSKAVEKELRRRFDLGGYKAYRLSKALEKAQIILVSTMPDYYAVNVFRLRTARALNDALDAAFEMTGKDARVWAIPHGHVTLPIMKVESR